MNSYFKIPNWITDPSVDITQNEASVLVCLCHLTNHKHQVCPSVATIAKCSRVSEKTVQRALRSLEAKRFIFSDQRAGETTVYTVNYLPKEIRANRPKT